MKNRILQPVLPFVALPLLTASAFAQMTGVSHPDQNTDTTITAPAQQSDHYVMPSHAAAPTDGTSVPNSTPAQASSYPTGSVPEVSYPATGAPPAADTSAASSQAVAPEQQPTPALIERRSLPATPATASSYAPVPTYLPEPTRSANADDGVVQVQLVPHQLNEGVILRARLDQAFSTESTPVGTKFSAQLLTDVGHSGEVLLPAGSTIHGRISAIHGGKRITGPASIRLQPESITLPDGTSYPLEATVAGIVSEEDQHVTAEGAIQPDSHPKETAIAVGSVTGAGAIMGAALGGGVGAVVGAGIGAGAGVVFLLKKDHQEMLPAGTALLFSLDAPLQLQPR